MLEDRPKKDRKTNKQTHTVMWTHRPILLGI